MDNNDLLRRLRYALRCDDAQTTKLIRLGNGRATPALAAQWRAKEADPDYAQCSAKTVEQFLDGLILDRRGPREAPAGSPWPDRSKDKPGHTGSEENPVQKSSDSSSTEGDATIAQMDNNVVLKQLRIALSLRSDGVHAILKAGGSSMSESEATALFRKPSARNYRQCGDQVLRQFIAGLVDQRQNESEEDANE